MKSYLSFSIVLGLLGATPAQSQVANPDTHSPMQAEAVASKTPQRVWVRDPRTGKLSQQELRMIDVPVTQWQQRIVEQTVYTPQVVLENQQIPQTFYVPQTQYVLRQRNVGSWNPFQPATIAYEQVPVTQWVPQVRTVTQQVPVQRLVPRKEQIAISEPIQSQVRTQQLAVAASSPVKSFAQGTANENLSPSEFAAASNAMPIQAASERKMTSAYALAGPLPLNGVPVLSGQPILGRLPLLAQQRVLPWTPLATESQLTSSLRPISVPAPFYVATGVSGAPARDPGQAAMTPTVVR